MNGFGMVLNDIQLSLHVASDTLVFLFWCGLVAGRAYTHCKWWCWRNKRATAKRRHKPNEPNEPNERWKYHDIPFNTATTYKLNDSNQSVLKTNVLIKSSLVHNEIQVNYKLDGAHKLGENFENGHRCGGETRLSIDLQNNHKTLKIYRCFRAFGGSFFSVLSIFIYLSKVFVCVGWLAFFSASVCHAWHSNGINIAGMAIVRSLAGRKMRLRADNREKCVKCESGFGWKIVATS